MADSTEQRTVKQIVGDDAYRQPDRRPGVVLPSASRGAAAESQLRSGKTPGEIMADHLGKVGRDIELSSGAKRGSMTHNGHPELPKK